MNNSKQYIAPLVCGFGAAVLSIIPGFKQISCCLLVPFAAFFSLYLEQRINKVNEPVSSRKAVTYGLLTGLFAALFFTSFEIILTFLTRTNDFVETLPDTEKFINNYNPGIFIDETFNAFKLIVRDIKNTGFSFLYLVIMLFSNLLTNTIFGLIGGLLGMNYLNKKGKKV